MSEKQRPGIMIYFDQYAPVSELSYEEIGRLLDACMRYARTGEEPELSGVVSIVWGFWRPLIDRDAETYRRKCQSAASAAQKRWSAQKAEELTEPGASEETDDPEAFSSCSPQD